MRASERGLMAFLRVCRDGNIHPRALQTFKGNTFQIPSQELTCCAENLRVLALFEKGGKVLRL
jgi:hypothetical protein